MIPFLMALAEAIPAAGKLYEAATAHEDKASTAAKVATDPNAPPEVKKAAANVASAALADKHNTENAALASLTGKEPKPQSGGSSTTMLVALGIGLLVLGRRR